MEMSGMCVVYGKRAFFQRAEQVWLAVEALSNRGSPRHWLLLTIPFILVEVSQNTSLPHICGSSWAFCFWICPALSQYWTNYLWSSSSGLCWCYLLFYIGGQINSNGFYSWQAAVAVIRADQGQGTHSHSKNILLSFYTFMPENHWVNYNKSNYSNSPYLIKG